MLLFLPSILCFNFAILVTVRVAAQRGSDRPVNAKCLIARSVVVIIRVNVCANFCHPSLPSGGLGSESGRRGGPPQLPAFDPTETDEYGTKTIRQERGYQILLKIQTNLEATDHIVRIQGFDEYRRICMPGTIY